MIEIKNINVELGINSTKKLILKNNSLKLDKGTITVLTGPSGSGKSTLLKTISLLIHPTSGEVMIDELSYSFPISEEIKLRDHFRINNGRQKMGIVFQDLHLIPHWTNYQNIVYPLKEMSSEQKHKLDFFIDLFQMNYFIHHYPNESSRGEEQRVALVRALMLNPEYLLLDEITSALDPEQTVNILKYCNSIKALGIGILIITHYIPFARKAADQVLFLDNGIIIEKGTNEILSNPKTERLSSFINSLRYIVGIED